MITPGTYEARGTLVVTPPRAELHAASERGDSLVSRRICDCADGKLLTGKQLREAEANARFIAKACNFHDSLVSVCEEWLEQYDEFVRDSSIGDEHGIREMREIVAQARGR
jgi:hypothetical protein